MLATSQRSSTASSSVRSLSLGNNHLIDIHPHKQEEILATINMTVDYVLDSMTGGRPLDVQWRPKATKKGVSYYVDGNVPADQYRFCCVTQTSARTEEIMKLFRITDTAALQRHARILYDNVLDARVLSVLEEPTKFNPYKSTYIRYTSLAAPKPLDDRDMCVAVATDMFTHEDGSTIGYCLWDSVDIPECPDYSKTLGLVRGHMFRSGYFCRTTNKRAVGGPTTQIVYFVGVEAGGLAPRLATKMVMERFGANLMRLCNHFRRKKLDPATFRPRDQWPSTRDASHCRACVKKFSAFSTRRHCSACGDVFCSPCCAKEEVDLPGVGIKALRFCLQCLGSRGFNTKPCQRSIDSSQSQSMAALHRAKSHPGIHHNPESPFLRLRPRSQGSIPSQAPTSPPEFGRTIVLPPRW